MFQIKKIEVHNNPFIGLYLTVCDDFLICSPYVPVKVLKAAEETLKTIKTCMVTIGNSHLTGLLTAANSKCVVVPQFTEEKEVKKIESDLGVAVCKIDDRFSAVKNNILINNNDCIVNRHLPKVDREKISKSCEVQVASSRFSIATVGSVNVVNGNGLLCYNGASEEEMQLLSSVFKVKAIKATCNFGSIATGLGIVANSKGALVGAFSSGFEVAKIFQALSSD